MKVVDFFRIVRKHMVLLIVAPLLIAAMVVVLTLHPDYKYASETTLFTGIATGSSVEMDKSFNYFVTNMAFDNLINIVKSRNTQQEVAIRLLSQHLMLKEPDASYLSAEKFAELKRITPAYIYKYVVTELPDATANQVMGATASLQDSLSGGLPAEKAQREIPPYISQAAYEKTVENLTNLMQSSDTNFVYELLNYPNPHYSFKELSTVKVERIGTSDLIKMTYETDDPGICQQTLTIFTNACIRNYRIIKENRSDAVVKYFENQLKLASERLKQAEEKLLAFNKENNIINYYEQSKAVAVVKEDLEVDYSNKRIKLAGFEAAIKRLEDKLNIQEQIQLKSSSIVDMRNRLGELNFRIATAETYQMADNADFKNLDKLKAEAEKLKEDLKQAVSEFYTYGNTQEGLPVSTLLNDWLTNVINAENERAGIKVLGDRIKEFQKQYSIYAPAGANIKKIEREISVSEEEFLEILHGLNLAKLKLQDNELSSNLKVVDPAFYPLSPIPTKRKVLILLGAIVGLILVLSVILAMEYLDKSLHDPINASKVLKLSPLGLVPRILLKTPQVPIKHLTNRLLELILQNMELYLKTGGNGREAKTILFFSTQQQEGKTVVAGNLALQLKRQGKKVLYLNYSKETLPSAKFQMAAEREVIDDNSIRTSNTKSSVISRIFGYPDNRIDYNSPFLLNPQQYLESGEYAEYAFDNTWLNVKSVKDLLVANRLSYPSYEYILIEIPSIIHYSYSSDLVAATDIPVLVCRANRTWSLADQTALDAMQKLTGKNSHFILNGTELEVVESVLGELPRKRSWIRKALKRIILFQFLSKNQI